MLARGDAWLERQYGSDSWARLSIGYEIFTKLDFQLVDTSPDEQQPRHSFSQRLGIYRSDGGESNGARST